MVHTNQITCVNLLKLRRRLIPKITWNKTKRSLITHYSTDTGASNAVLNNTIQSWVMKEKHGGGIALLLKPISPLASTDCARGWMHVIASSFRWSQLYRLSCWLYYTRFVCSALCRLTYAFCLRVSSRSFIAATSFCFALWTSPFHDFYQRANRQSMPIVSLQREALCDLSWLE